jgi:toxin YhaV
LSASTSTSTRRSEPGPCGSATGADPAHKRFEQGETLGPARKHWRRGKFYQQYRLFFRFSTAAKVVVLAWVNDERTKRACGSRADAYLTFARM